MELEEAVMDFEAADKGLADRDPKRLMDFLLLAEHQAWSNGLKNAVFDVMCDPSVKFKVEGRRVYREIHKAGSCYREEHLAFATPLRDIPLYKLVIVENVEKVPQY
jgi:hypothetical protein